MPDVYPDVTPAIPSYYVYILQKDDILSHTEQAHTRYNTKALFIMSILTLCHMQSD